MSEDIAAVYTSTLHNALRLFPAWPVNAFLQLGDYGTLRGGMFSKIGNIEKDFGIKLVPDHVGAESYFEFASANTSEIKTSSGMEASIIAPTHAPITARARLAITFEGSNSVYFRAYDCSHHALSNMTAVSERIMDLFRQGTWAGNHCFISTQFQSGATTVIVSNGANASIEIESTGGDMASLDLVNANAGVSIRSMSNIGFRTIAQPGLTPLFGLSQVQPRIRWLSLLGGGGKQVQLVHVAATDAGPVPTIPGHLVTNLPMQISPEIAKGLGKSVEEVFQVVELL